MRSQAIVWITAVIMLCAVTSPARALDPAKTLNQYVHDVWDSDDGLPQISVQTITQTPDGYLWAGTQEGLVRFDGVAFRVFDKKNSPTIGHNNISALVVGPGGELWAGTNGGGLLCYQDGEFRAWTSADGLSSDVILSLALGEDGTVWIGTSVGLNTLRGGEIGEIRAPAGRRLGGIESLLIDRGGVVWAGTRSAGVARVTGGHAEMLTGEHGLPDGAVYALHQGVDGTVWIGSEAGLSRWLHGALDRCHFAGPLASVTIKSIHEDRERSLWVGTEYDGLYRLRDRELANIGVADGLPHHHVMSLFEDQEGSLWMGLLGGGLNRLRDAAFITIGTREGLTHDDVWTVCEDSAGQLWVGTEVGLNVLVDGRPSHFPEQSEFRNIAVMSALQDHRDGAMWFGTYGEGVSRVAGGEITVFDAGRGLANDNVLVLAQASDGAIWVGTVDGLSRIQRDAVTSFGPEHGLPHTNIRVIHEDRGGTLWIGTEGGGLARWVDGAFQPVDLGAEIAPAQRVVYSIHEDQDGTLWFGTAGGLLRYRDGSTVAITSRQGLYNETIYRILDDGAGNLWMSCNKGIFRVSQEQLAAVADGELAAVESHTYGRAHGMKEAECNGGAQPAGARSRDGTLWFPTIAGVVTLDPAELKTNLVPPPLRIESVVADGASWDPSVEIVFPPGTRRFEFHYTAPTFLGPEQVRFRFQLGGLDRDWEEAGTRRAAYYPLLGPGSYEFRVTACNSDGVWNEEPAVFPFTVQPYFYETRLFQVLLLLGLLGAMASAFGLRIKQLRVREKTLEAAVRERTSQLHVLTEELRELSLRDPLTGLRNRRFLFERIADMKEHIDRQRDTDVHPRKNRRERRHADVLGVFLIDIDHFKRVNDELGHDAGDLVLRQFAGVLLDTVRADDIAVRWGGEEFLVVLPQADRHHLRIFAERLRRNVEAEEFLANADEPLHKTCSVGFAPYPFYDDEDAESDLSFEEIIRAADLGLYVAKDEGRNRVVLVSPGEKVPHGEEQRDQALSDPQWAEEQGYLKIRR